jgi:hypothetical protein
VKGSDILAILLAAVLLVVGLNGLFTPYPRNWLKLRWRLGDGMPWAWKIRVPKILGAILIAGALTILLDVGLDLVAPADGTDVVVRE